MDSAFKKLIYWSGHTHSLLGLAVHQLLMLITSFILGNCIKQTMKKEARECLQSSYLINSGYRLHVVVSLFFNCVIIQMPSIFI